MDIYGPSNLTYLSPGVFRYLSLQAADNSEKIALAVDNTKRIFGQPITSDSSDNDKWMLKQLSPNNNFFYFQHLQTGLYLASQNNKLVLSQLSLLQTYDEKSSL